MGKWLCVGLRVEEGKGEGRDGAKIGMNSEEAYLC